MGRVDEAMRRAAEIGSRSRQERADLPSGSELPTGEAFPPEYPDRPHHLRPVIASAESPARPLQEGPSSQKASILPPLAERLNVHLERKVVIDEGMDPASREQYRRLVTGLHAAQASSGLKVVMLASALASEGKTLTASNIALTLSESYQRNVLLIDADLRRPSLHEVFGLPCSPGLSEGMLSPDDRKLPLHRVSARLTVLTAGLPTGDPMAALASERMHRLVHEAREAFDWVIIDTPPIGLLSDASLLAASADGAILVVKAESTPCDLVERAVAALGRDRLLGVVLNRARVTAGPDYKYHGYYQSTPPVASGR